MKQSIPEVFVAICENQAARAAIQAQKVITMEAASSFKVLKDDMDKSLRPAAQALLRRPGGKGSRGRA